MFLPAKREVEAFWVGNFVAGGNAGAAFWESEFLRRLEIAGRETGLKEGGKERSSCPVSFFAKAAGLPATPGRDRRCCGE